MTLVVQASVAVVVGPQGPYIYRRLAVVSGARAIVQPMAISWAVVIYGWIGRNTIKIMEQYNTRPEARSRSHDVNRRRIAVVESIEEVLYPRSYIEARIDIRVNNSMANSLPPRAKKLKPYTNAQDIYDMYRRDSLSMRAKE